MKIFASAALLLVQGCTADVYGPKNCVSLDRSQEGTCVIKTNCAGLDTSKFEFAFDCTTDKHAVQRHSFGFGGFDDNEEFDTSVKCTICDTPRAASEHHVAAKAASKPVVPAPAAKPAKAVSGEVKPAAAAKPAAAPEVKPAAAATSAISVGAQKAVTKLVVNSDADTAVVKYGPGECVSTYKNPAGHCVMKTQCEGVNITEYEFGLICVDKSGEPVRHVFGRNSFDADESFDTLIMCDKCLGLDDMPEDGDLYKVVQDLTQEVESLNKTLSVVRVDVKKLKGKVMPAPAPAKPVSFHATAAAKKVEEKKVQAKSTAQKKLRGKKKSHHQKHKVQKAEVDEDDTADSAASEEDRDQEVDAEEESADRDSETDSEDQGDEDYDDAQASDEEEDDQSADDEDN